MHVRTWTRAVPRMNNVVKLAHSWLPFVQKKPRNDSLNEILLSGWREKAYNGQTCTFLLRPSVKPISIYKNCSFRRALCHSLQTNRGYRLKKNESDFLFLEIFSSVCFCATLSFVHQTLTYRYIIFCLYFSLFTQKNIVRVVCINIIAIIIFFICESINENKWNWHVLVCHVLLLISELFYKQVNIE